MSRPSVEAIGGDPRPALRALEWIVWRCLGAGRIVSVVGLLALTLTDDAFPASANSVVPVALGRVSARTLRVRSSRPRDGGAWSPVARLYVVLWM